MKQQLETFLMKVDSDFTVPLSTRVDLTEFANKLSNDAVLLTIFEKGEIQSLVAMYCNNYETLYAYITIVATSKFCRGRGLGRILVKNAIDVARSKGFTTLGLHTDNPSALRLYESLGFKVTGESEKKYLELKL